MPSASWKSVKSADGIWWKRLWVQAGAPDIINPQTMSASHWWLWSKSLSGKRSGKLKGNDIWQRRRDYIQGGWKEETAAGQTPITMRSFAKGGGGVWGGGSWASWTSPVSSLNVAGRFGRLRSNTGFHFKPHNNAAMPYSKSVTGSSPGTDQWSLCMEFMFCVCVRERERAGFLQFPPTIQWHAVWALS